ncbi:hypothetical protein OG241_08290 [Streptomyces sp. NBC_01390]|uniref:hypothetical protein n=1 Tax=Streptomyces sp. NBC_01390 TaxID=2903850 RepID=UPI00324810D9
MTTDPRALQLAKNMHRLAREKATKLPEWKDLPLSEREKATTEARLWLRAAVEAGIAPLADRPADCSQPAVPRPVAGEERPTTAEAAAELGITPTAYRVASHRAAVDRIRAAAKGLYAGAGVRVLAALDAVEEQQADEEPITGPQDCGHDDYHDGHPWHEKPHIWCPGHSYNDDTAVAQPGKEA